jgi:hypothetical protein
MIPKIPTTRSTHLDPSTAPAALVTPNINLNTNQRTKNTIRKTTRTAQPPQPETAAPATKAKSNARIVPRLNFGKRGRRSPIPSTRTIRSINRFQVPSNTIMTPQIIMIAPMMPLIARIAVLNSLPFLFLRPNTPTMIATIEPIRRTISVDDVLVIVMCPLIRGCAIYKSAF